MPIRIELFNPAIQRHTDLLLGAAASVGSFRGGVFFVDRGAELIAAHQALELIILVFNAGVALDVQVPPNPLP
jgi:hypothetical protein